MGISSQFDVKASDWRAQLRRNARNTRWVIFLFLLIYTGLGLLIDVLILQSRFPGAPFALYFQALLTMQVFPWATLTMGITAIVALLITFSLYDRIMLMGTDYRLITPASAQNLQEKQLYHVVEEMRVAAGLHYLPKIYLIEANYMNAFATGYSEKSAMVAITRGLMEKLDRAELQAVMAHELSHIRHSDIKLTLTVTILSNLILIILDILFYSFLYGRGGRRERNGNLFLVILILRYVLPLITIVLTLFLSRTREYMADAGAVELMRDNEPLARALLKINQDHRDHTEEFAHEYRRTAHEQIRQASYLFDPSSINAFHSSMLFATHPSIEQRLKALGFYKKNQ